MAAKWFASGGGIFKMGPYDSQVEAWRSLEYAPNVQDRLRAVHPADAKVWPVAEEPTPASEARAEVEEVRQWIREAIGHWVGSQ